MGWLSAGKGEAVVMLHSSMSSKSQWGSLMETLRRTHKVVAVDLYGYGEAPFVPREKVDTFTLDDELTLIQRALSENIDDDEPFHLVGHSYGGAVAMHLALVMPERIRSLSLYEPMANHVVREIDDGLYATQKELMGTVIDAIDGGDLKLGASMFVDFFSGQGLFSHLPGEVQEMLAGCVKKMPLDYFASAHQGLRMGRYGNLSAPTCLMAGRQSPDLTFKISQALSEVIPNVDYQLVDAGHMAPLTDGSKVNPIIAAHVRRHTCFH
ncbi:alpha/beta hydrolase [Desulfoluna sp.]|uniref:alpha/beta fold hydrolase n=1 Tax=Desulfoluna sp. TaxID=2045199 RepID=UPI002630168E|nr:alpha/beta hydrolase [Desulfoluna sp.]